MKNTTVGVIGVGYLGRFHALKYAAMEEVDLAGVVDVDYARAQAVAEETGTKAYSDYREIMDSLDAVSISVPTTMHEEIAIPLLERGIGVLLEKP
ncbi:MAG: Gfo/Idh/MocA family oxidoreductase, partial [Thermodesulfobacteriota bacterium]|nr:Gfo/Idh/MocA family oxidoreductase [Thermodesulfobacteriota bacterium]